MQKGKEDSRVTFARTTTEQGKRGEGEKREKGMTTGKISPLVLCSLGGSPGKKKENGAVGNLDSLS